MTRWEGKCGHANLIFQANCCFSACASSDGVWEQQLIKRDSLCKHYVGHRPHPLPSTEVFFFLNQQPLLPSPDPHMHIHVQPWRRYPGTEGWWMSAGGWRSLTRHVSLPCTGHINAAPVHKQLAREQRPGPGVQHTQHTTQIYTWAPAAGVTRTANHTRCNQTSTLFSFFFEQAKPRWFILFCWEHPSVPVNPAKPFPSCILGAGVGRGTVFWMVESWPQGTERSPGERPSGPRLKNRGLGSTLLIY